MGDFGGLEVILGFNFVKLAGVEMVILGVWR
jgi:hypothetical protein